MRSRALAPAHGAHALGSSSRWSFRPGSGFGSGSEAGSGAEVVSPAEAATGPRGIPFTSTSALVFLRGRDADGRLVALGAVRRVARPLLGALAIALRRRGAHHALARRLLARAPRGGCQDRAGVGAGVGRAREPPEAEASGAVRRGELDDRSPRRGLRDARVGRGVPRDGARTNRTRGSGDRRCRAELGSKRRWPRRRGRQ
jgi:hypothetical protein